MKKEKIQKIKNINIKQNKKLNIIMTNYQKEKNDLEINFQKEKNEILNKFKNQINQYKYMHNKNIKYERMKYLYLNNNNYMNILIRVSIQFF